MSDVQQAPSTEQDRALLKQLMKAGKAKCSPAAYDALYQLLVHGPREADEIPSMAGLGEAIYHDWASHIEDSEQPYRITNDGLKETMRHYGTIFDPHYKIFGVLIVGFAEICGGGELDGQPLHKYGEVTTEWLKENLFETHFKWADSFSAYDYATFDFVHPVTGVITHLKPGDAVVLKEDHNHTVHKFSPVE